MGVEVELLAPSGLSRKDLAMAIAAQHGAHVRRFFHPQGEPSKVPGQQVFENLTLGFSVEDQNGDVLAQCVDDITLQGDLNRDQPPQPGWYRIVSDDRRLTRLIKRHADPESPVDEVLNPIAELFGTKVERGEGGMARVADEYGDSIAIAAPLPGQRERGCELITPPIDNNHFERLESLLGLARALDFTIPAEGAIHLHFDATPLCSAAAIANLVNLLAPHADSLKRHLKTNPRCRRLGPWPRELGELVNASGFAELTWEEARERLSQLPLTKYCDFNLFNIAHSLPNKHTFEVRILPVTLEAGQIVRTAASFAAMLEWACESKKVRSDAPTSFARFKERFFFSPYKKNTTPYQQPCP